MHKKRTNSGAAMAATWFVLGNVYATILMTVDVFWRMSHPNASGNLILYKSTGVAYGVFTLWIVLIPIMFLSAVTGWVIERNVRRTGFAKAGLIGGCISLSFAVPIMAFSGIVNPALNVEALGAALIFVGIGVWIGARSVRIHQFSG